MIEHAVRAHVLERFLHAALVLAELQDAAHVLGRRQHHRRDDRLFDLRDVLFGQLRRAVDLEHLPVGRRHPVEHARRGRHEIHVELALEPLLHDLHVEQAEEAAAESKPERSRRFGLEEKRRVVEPQLLERLAQLGVLMALDRIQARKHHRLQLFEAGKRLRRRPVGLGDRVADLRVAHGLDVRDDEADFAGPEIVDRHRLRRKHADLIDLVVLPLRHQPDLRALPQRAFEHPRDDDDAAIRVVPRVEDQRLQRRRRVAFRRRQAMDHRFEHLGDADALFRARQNGARSVEADDLLDLPPRLFGLGAGQIDLVDDGNDLEVVLDREIGVRERLRFDALRRIDEQQRALARGQRPRDFVREIDVPRRVDQVEDVGLPVLGRVVQPDGMRLDGDAALALEIHRVEHLRLHLAGLQRAGRLEKAVGQRRLAVIDMGDDGEIADALRIHAVRGQTSCLSEAVID